MPRSNSNTVTKSCKHCGRQFTVPSYRLKGNPCRFCSRVCVIKHRWASRPPVAERFLEMVGSADSNGCRLWAGKMHINGYGLFCGKYAHRVAWELANSQIPAGSHVLHRCDVRACCEPSHLFLGDQASNIADMVCKGRQQSVLASTDIRMIRALKAMGRQDSEIAAAYGVAQATIWCIFNRGHWKHVE